MSNFSKWLARLGQRIEDNTNHRRRKHGLPEDHRASEYREKKYAERAKKKGGKG